MQTTVSHYFKRINVKSIKNEKSNIMFSFVRSFYNQTMPTFSMHQYNQIIRCPVTLASIQVRRLLGSVQTSNFTWAELDPNELKQRTSLIYI